MDTHEGNLLELTDDLTAEAQIEALRYAVHLSGARLVLETGTQKSLFGLLLSLLACEVTLYTFDGQPACQTSVDMLNAGQASVRPAFTLGDTKHTLPVLAGLTFDLAWIDGGHDYATAFSDVTHAMRLHASVIAVDDVRTMPDVAPAIEHALALNVDYQRHANPFVQWDSRGMALLTNTFRL